MFGCWSQNTFCCKKKNKIIRALSPFSFIAVRIVLEWLFPFWFCCLFALGFCVFSYLISVLVCTMWYQETECLSSPIIWEGIREKDFLYYISWSSYWLSKRMMFRQSNNVLIIWLPATICMLARIWISILLVCFCEVL